MAQVAVVSTECQWEIALRKHPPAEPRGKEKNQMAQQTIALL